MLWRLFLRLAPTAALQSALSSREGVAVHTIEPDRQRTFKLCGPATVVIIRE